MASGRAIRRNELQWYTPSIPKYSCSFNKESRTPTNRPSLAQTRPSKQQGRRRSQRIPPSLFGVLRQLLPEEILHRTLVLLDVRTVLAVRRVNTFYRRTVDGMSEYHLIQSHTPQIFKILNTTRSDSFIYPKDIEKNPSY